ncbi:MAG TPA: SWIM zinc finger family protein [Bryobacteraceae bacterium]|nr:SWIM zinc finger family protein [Bryobacteraceae bacterium]
MPRSGDDFWRDRFPPRSSPREARGGIRAATKRGRFGESWWARRWIEVLESFDIGARLARGRSYARKGQVLSIDVRKGSVEARVQGSRPEPYLVNIKVRPLMPSEWKRLAGQLSSQAIFAAKLLAGEMPQDIENAFRKAKLSLFPEKLKEISTACSCPDWSNPCKHVAAVYYLLGEEFDRDPFLIFRLRGVERDEFLAMLGERRAREIVEPAEQTEPLPAAPADFWTGKPLPGDLLGDVSGARVVAALPRRLGNLQFWRGEVNLIEALEPAYEGGGKAGQKIAGG